MRKAMNRTPNDFRRIALLALAALVPLSASLLVAELSARQNGPQQPMTFFVTSAGSGNGANLGGLAGADRLCQALAAAAGAGARTWHAYLSTQAVDGQPAVNA